MYEDLIAELREEAEWAKANEWETPIMLSDHLEQAADAIEELFGKVEQLPRWIPVTEQLPDAYEDVLLKFPNNQAAGFVDRDGCWGVYSGDGFYTEVADNEPKPTHWAKKLPEPPKEE